MSAVMYGADADELDRLAAEFSRAADELDREGGTLTGILNNISWFGDTAGRFLTSWTGVQLPKIGLSTRFLRDTARLLSKNAAAQRQASESSGPGHPTATGRRPTPVALSRRHSGDGSKAGAVVRGVDYAYLEIREMSDGTVQVDVRISSGTEVDVGDALSIASIRRGKFFAENGFEFDLDGSLTSDDLTTFTFSDPDSAQLFYDALRAKQGALSNALGGFAWDDVLGVIRDNEFEGEASWEGYRAAVVASGDMAIGIRAGDDDAGKTAATELSIGGAKAFVPRPRCPMVRPAS